MDNVRERAASKRMRRIFVLWFGIVAGVFLLAALGNVRTHATGPAVENSATLRKEPAGTARTDGQKKGAKGSDDKVQGDQETVIVHGSLSGDLKPEDDAPWRKWLQK
jgi:hypothetical protein